MKRPFGRGITLLRGLTITMVINHLLNGMILQVIQLLPSDPLIPQMEVTNNRLNRVLWKLPSLGHSEEPGCYFFWFGDKHEKNKHITKKIQQLHKSPNALCFPFLGWWNAVTLKKNLFLELLILVLFRGNLFFAGHFFCFLTSDGFKAQSLDASSYPKWDWWGSKRPYKPKRKSEMSRSTATT